MPFDFNISSVQFNSYVTYAYVLHISHGTDWTQPVEQWKQCFDYTKIKVRNVCKPCIRRLCEPFREWIASLWDVWIIAWSSQFMNFEWKFPTLLCIFSTYFFYTLRMFRFTSHTNGNTKPKGARAFCCLMVDFLGLINFNWKKMKNNCRHIIWMLLPCTHRN